MKKDTKIDFSGQIIYVGIDVHKKSWSVCILTEHLEHKTFTQPPVPEVLLGYLKRTFPGATFYTVYEAGFCGFWICERLRQLGVECIVVHPGDVPIKDKERRRKSDPRDARKLARTSRSGELDPLYIPTVEQLQDRSLIRMRKTISKEQSRIKNRIKSLLHFYGIAVPERFDNRIWSGVFIHWLKDIQNETEAGRATLHSLLRQLQNYRKEQVQIDREIRVLAKSERYRNKVTLLKLLPGIGLISAVIWLTELIDIRRFKRFDELTSFVGLVPREHSSGDSQNFGSLEHRGNRYLRAILIENSCVAVRKDPQLMLDYHNYLKRMTGNKAIICIARKLLRRIRFVLINEQPYVTPNMT